MILVGHKGGDIAEKKFDKCFLQRSLPFKPAWIIKDDGWMVEYKSCLSFNDVL